MNKINTDNISINTQSSIRIKTKSGTIIYFDPFRITKETHDADTVFFTHAHYDHFSPEDFKKVVKENTVFICPKSMVNDLLKEGISKNKIISMAPGEIKTIYNIKTEAVPAYNTNKPMHQKSYGWLGYIIELDGIKYYICGDMDITPEAEKIKCDVIFVPIGGTFTMNSKEAAELVNTVKPEIAIPIHYGSIVGTPGDAKVFKKNIKSGISVIEKLEF